MTSLLEEETSPSLKRLSQYQAIVSQTVCATVHCASVPPVGLLGSVSPGEVRRTDRIWPLEGESRGQGAGEKARAGSCTLSYSSDTSAGSYSLLYLKYQFSISVCKCVETKDDCIPNYIVH